jgi:hypothetical protein
MHVLITFCKGKRELTSFPYAIRKPEDYPAAIGAAYAQFKREHPDMDLFAGIHVIFDRIDDTEAGKLTR